MYNPTRRVECEAGLRCGGCAEAGRGVLVWRAADSQIDVVLTPLRDDEWLSVFYRELPAPLQAGELLAPESGMPLNGGKSGRVAVTEQADFGDGLAPTV